jgi:hypothetical protein
MRALLKKPERTTSRPEASPELFERRSFDIPERAQFWKSHRSRPRMVINLPAPRDNIPGVMS